MVPRPQYGQAKCFKLERLGTEHFKCFHVVTLDYCGSLECLRRVDFVEGFAQVVRIYEIAVLPIAGRADGSVRPIPCASSDSRAFRGEPHANCHLRTRY